MILRLRSTPIKRFFQLLLLLVGCCWSCQDQADQAAETSSEPVFHNQAHELVYNMVQKVGSYEKLLDLKDVIYTYSYTVPDGREDVTTEKYLFDGERSYGVYTKHERTMPTMEGKIEQGFDGTTFWLRHNGKYMENDSLLNRVAFNRKTNFYWFAMMQKLLDPGLNYEYIEAATVDGSTYDVVDVTFDAPAGTRTDIYRLYINRATSLVDQFLFTVVDYNVVETPFLMRVEYEELDGILIPTLRQYTQATWEGEPLNDNWIQVRWTDIQFNNGLTKELFESTI